MAEYIKAIQKRMEDGTMEEIPLGAEAKHVFLNDREDVNSAISTIKKNIVNISGENGIISNEITAIKGTFDSISENISIINNTINKIRYVQVTLPTPWVLQDNIYTNTISHLNGITPDWIPGVPVLIPNDSGNYTISQQLKAMQCIGRIDSKNAALTFTCYEDQPSCPITIRIPGMIA